MPKLYELLLTKSTLLGWSRWRSTHRAERRSSEIFRFRPVSESSSGRETVSATIISGNHCIKSSAQCIVIVTCHSARPKMVCAFRPHIYLWHTWDWVWNPVAGLNLRPIGEVSGLHRIVWSRIRYLFEIQIMSLWHAHIKLFEWACRLSFPLFLKSRRANIWEKQGSINQCLWN